MKIKDGMGSRSKIKDRCTVLQSLLYNNCTTSQEPGNTESTDERIQLFQQRYSNKIEVIDNF